MTGPSRSNAIRFLARPTIPFMSRPQRLLVVLAMDLGLVVALVATGLSARSLALLAEGIDYLADAAGVALSLGALMLARHPASVRLPFGHEHASTYAAFLNACWLLFASVAVTIGAIRRLLGDEVVVKPVPIIAVSAAAAAAMVIAVIVLRGDAADDDVGGGLLMRAVVLDTVGDVASAAGVAVTGVVILLTDGWYWLDAAVALAIAVAVGWHAAALLRRVWATLRVIRSG